MPNRTVLANAFAAVAVALALAGCGHPRGDLTITNDSTQNANVSTGDQDVTVDAGTSASILDYGCTRGDVTVKLDSHEQIVVHGPVCPKDTIVIHDDGTVDLKQGSADG